MSAFPLSEHFNRGEFACKCGCGQDTVDTQLITVLERIRTELNEPVIITSGNRCPTHNTVIGGSVNSQHMSGKAADIVVKNVTPSQVYSMLDTWYPRSLGVGVYNSWVHVDVRDERARWDKTT